MGCGCLTKANNGDDGKAIVDLVRSKGKENFPLRYLYKIDCSCGSTFTMKTLVDKCVNCNMTYGFTPCGQNDKNNVKPAGINY